MNEHEYWRRLVCELHQQFTLEYLAQEFGVTVRQVSNWKKLGDRPRGMTAVKIYLFHAKHRTEVPTVSTMVHGAIGSASIIS